MASNRFCQVMSGIDYAGIKKLSSILRNHQSGIMYTMSQKKQDN